MDDKLLAIWLNEAVGPGRDSIKNLLVEYGSFEVIYGLSERDYERFGIKRNSYAMAKLLDKNLENHKKTLSFCECNYFEVIEFTSDMFPQRLRAIKNPPAVIYARGRMIDFDDNVCIAVVGTRSYTDIGWDSTYKVASGLAGSGAVVVTGLASGIDTAATRAALDASGFAVGVLGSGVERIYPSENKELFEEMYRRGLVISERPPFSEITGRYFPVRNRIISGLCNGVLVGEGGIRSGAMITAGHASEQGRSIYAIPGVISGDESAGVNKLIREGAIPVFDANDILEKYLYSYPHRIGKSSDVKSFDVPAERSSKRIRVIKGTRSGTGSSAAVGGTDKSGYSPDNPIKTDNAGVTKKAKIDKPVKKNIYENPVFRSVCVEEKKDTAQISGAVRNDESDIPQELNGAEREVYRLVRQKGTVTADALCGELGLDAMTVNIALTSLEVFGYVETSGPNVSVKKI